MTNIPYEEKKYQKSEAVTQAQHALQNQQAAKPGEYKSQWQQGMDDLLAQYQNRKPFQYDVNADAMYQQMVDRYMQQGKQAMMDTVGQVSALTGGYGNSYAMTAGQQAYQDYLQGAYDQTPQYYQMALDRYKTEGDNLLQQYGMLADRESMAYDRYSDDLDRYYAELDRLQGVYDSERDYDYGIFENDRAFDYGKYQDDRAWQYQAERDSIEDDQWNQQWNYQQERDRIADEQWKREFEESIRQYDENMAWQKAQAAAKTSGRGSGGSSGGGKKEDNAKEIDVEKEYLDMKKAGAKTMELDNYLRQMIDEGYIEKRAATGLREKRW